MTDPTAIERIRARRDAAAKARPAAPQYWPRRYRQDVTVLLAERETLLGELARVCSTPRVDLSAGQRRLAEVSAQVAELSGLFDAWRAEAAAAEPDEPDESDEPQPPAAATPDAVPIEQRMADLGKLIRGET